MNDFIWFKMIGILFVLLGIVFIMLGLQIWKKQRMDLIISYHNDKVKEENKKAYCTLSGIGMIVTGVGFLGSAVCLVFKQTSFIFVPMLFGLLSGLILLIIAGKKYNH